MGSMIQQVLNSMSAGAGAGGYGCLSEDDVAKLFKGRVSALSMLADFAEEYIGASDDEEEVLSDLQSLIKTLREVFHSLAVTCGLDEADAESVVSELEDNLTGEHMAEMSRYLSPGCLSR